MPQKRIPSGEAGFMIIEVLASAVVLLIVSAGIFGLLQATAHSSSEDRHRSEAYSVSQEDQARLRSKRLAALNDLNETRTVTLNGAKFDGPLDRNLRQRPDGLHLRSAAKGRHSADYVKITSKVTWPRMTAGEAGDDREHRRAVERSRSIRTTAPSPSR